MLVDHTAYPLEFAKTASNQPDLTMFDSSVMQRAEHASRFHVVNNRPLLMALVGDNLLSVIVHLLVFVFLYNQF